jgi:hypothetical protein
LHGDGCDGTHTPASSWLTPVIPTPRDANERRRALAVGRNEASRCKHASTTLAMWGGVSRGRGGALPSW